MGHSHAQDGELVRFACEGTAGGNHVGQLCDVLCHLIPPTSFNFTVILSESRIRAGEKNGRV